MKYEYQDDIDRFLKEQMTEDEQKEFKRKMERSAELRDQMDFTNMVRKTTISRNEKLESISEWNSKPTDSTNLALMLCHTRYHICLT